MLIGAADDGVKHRIAPVGDAVDLGDMPVRAFAVILREFAERPFGRAPARQNAALEHDLGVGRHAHRVAEAFHNLKRLAV